MNRAGLHSLISLTCAVFVVFADDCPPIKSIRNWGGRPPTEVDYQTFPVEYVVIHHTVSQKCSTFSTCADRVKNIQDYHMIGLGWYNIGYNFLIGNDGNVYEGTGWHKIGAHTYGYNSKSIGIAFIGNFDEELPTEAALDAAKKLLDCGVKLGELSRRYKLVGGRQVSSTVSPGLALFNEIQKWNNWAVNP